MANPVPPLKISNMEGLIQNGMSDNTKNARAIVLESIEEVLNEISPRAFMQRNVHFNSRKNKFKVGQRETDLSEIDKVIVIGGGKGSGYMAEEIEKILGDRISSGYVNILRGTAQKFKTTKIKLNEASHPLSDPGGVKGVEHMLKLVTNLHEDDLVVCLISGGGSALLPYPKPPLNLEEKQQTVELLMKAGVDIHGLNAVRKHLSEIKGGQLARKCQPAQVISLILSDVVGDDLDTIASGPTAPDDTTFGVAKRILVERQVWNKIPDNARKVIDMGLEQEIPETPKQGDPIFRNVWNYLIGSNMFACLFAMDALSKRGIRPKHLTSTLEGEAREVGLVIGSVIENIKNFDSPFPKPCALVAGGETVVTVTGGGKGGRNQELVLSASRKIKDMSGIALASVGTDGVDGSSDAAGAVVDGETISRSSASQLVADDYLVRNDSNSFFRRLGDDIVTGPTGTNVNDLLVAVIF